MFMIPTYYLETDSGVSRDVYRTIEEQVLFRSSYPQIVAEFETEQENKKVKTKSMQHLIKKIKTVVDIFVRIFGCCRDSELVMQSQLMKTLTVYPFLFHMSQNLRKYVAF